MATGTSNGMRTSAPTAPAQQSQTITPTYLSTLLQGALPQVESSQIAAPQAAGYLSQGYTPTTAQGVDASGYGSDALIKQILSGTQPVFDQQQRALRENLANAGIVGGSTVGAGTDLANTQITQLLSQIVPAIQAAQQMQLGASEFNATGQNQNAQYNASNQLQNNQFNAGVLNNNSQYNAGNQLAAGQFNASGQNQASLQNTQNSLNAAQYDAGVANTMTSQILGYQNQDYLQRLNNQLALNQNSQNQQTAAYQPNYTQAAPVNFSGLAGAFGSAQGAKTAAPAPFPTTPASYTPEYGRL